MTVPVPDLDDRRFQDLVDDAKRLVQQRCPEWNDHNVSDPGVTLIETFAFMVDQLIYRLNRVPDKLYLAFLDLIGVQPHAPTAASTELTFWLSAPQPEPIVVPAGSQASTVRTENEEATVFETTQELVVPPRELIHVTTHGAGGEPVSRGTEVLEGTGFACFTTPPAEGDALLFGLDDAAPRCAVALRFDCDVQGAGVDPRFPPLQWQAWDGTGWVACDLDQDGTGGLNKPGDVIVHVPPSHVPSVVGGLRAGWLRCLVVPPEVGFPPYRVAPQVRSVTAFTIGGTTPSVHAERVLDEIVGLSEGVPGQAFPLARRPVIDDGNPVVVEVAGGSGWEVWTEVATFAQAGPQSPVVRADRANGMLHFGPAVREADGSLTRHGAVPPKGAPMRIPMYRTGGGPRGNVASRALRVLRTSLPFVERVENRRPGLGGVAAETVEEVKLRGPMQLRTQDRAVTVEDYEVLARRAAPEVARVRCVPATGAGEAGGVRLLVVPSAARDAEGRLRFEDLVPSEEVLARIGSYLDERRVLGARLVVEPPFFQGVTVVARLTARPRVAIERLRADARAALYRYFDPLSGGPDGVGWPFGRPVQAGEVYAVLQQLAGTEIVDDVRLFAADPITGLRGEPVQRIELEANALAFSFDHQVRVGKGR